MLANVLAVQEKPVLLLSRFLKLLQVSVTGATAQTTLLNHPDYPSLLSISDALRTWKVNNIATRIPKEQLTQLPLPFIAHTYAGGSENFALVTAADDKSVHYFMDGKELTDTVDAFVKHWTGVVLLAEKTDASGEKSYVAARRKEKLAALQFLALLLIFITVSVASVVSFSDQSPSVAATIGVSVLMLLKLTGIAVTSLLLWYEIDKANPALQKICTAGAKTNCNAILGSKQSKLFSWLSWSEVGFFYFASTFISLLIADFSASVSSLSVIFLLNVFALPYTVFSLYYQWRIAKQWCLLCLSVQALLLLELITSFSTSLLSSSFFSFHIISSFPHAISSSLPVISSLLFVAFTWFLIKPLLLKAEEAKRTKRELLRLKASPQIWEALLAKGKKIEKSADGLGIALGNPDAANTLIKVCNPYCGPCAKAHPEIEKLLEENSNLKVQIIFTATADENDFKAPPVKHLLAIAEKEDEQLTKQALDDWYLADKKDYNLFATKYPMNGELKKQDAKIEAMKAWCDETKIAFTPTIFVNGHQLPDVYNIADLQHFLQ